MEREIPQPSLIIWADRSGPLPHRMEQSFISKGLKGIRESGVIIAKDNNRVYLELANKKPLSIQQAEEKYQIKKGKKLC